MENNSFGISYSQWEKDEKLRKEDPKAYKKLQEERLEIFKNIANTGVDFVPFLGDVKAFAEAEDKIDYLLATVALIPGAETLTKLLKEAKLSYQSAKQINNIAEAQKHLDTANSLMRQSLSGIYSSREIRTAFENQYGKGMVLSKTVPPSNAKNVKLAGQRHPITNVPFDEKGFPIFDKFAMYDTKLELNRFQNISYTEQMKMATKDLINSIENGSINKSKFTATQLEAIYRGDSKIPGFTWHHHQDTGRMQLIDSDIHKRTGHIGGEGMKNGK